MALVKMPPAKFETYPVDLRATATVTGARLRLTVRAPSSRATVRKFAIVHERPMHLFVVGNGLEFFAHEHPGPAAGRRLHDRPRAAEARSLHGDRRVPARGGDGADVPAAVHDRRAPSTRSSHPRSTSSPKIVDGLRVSLDTSKLKPGAATPLVVTIADAATGADGARPRALPRRPRAPAHRVGRTSPKRSTAIPEDDGRPALTFTPLVPTRRRLQGVDPGPAPRRRDHCSVLDQGGWHLRCQPLRCRRMT